MEFNSLEELYKRVTPALKIKANESNNTLIEKDIWDYLTYTKWVNGVDLTLAGIVDDILKCDIYLVKSYKNK